MADVAFTQQDDRSHPGRYSNPARLRHRQDAPKLTASDLARAKLRVGGKDVSRKEFSAAVNAHLGKQRVSIMLDGSVIAFFKARCRNGDKTTSDSSLDKAPTFILATGALQCISLSGGHHVGYYCNGACSRQ